MASEYGAIQHDNGYGSDFVKPHFSHARRRRLNLGMVMLAIFVPWLVFSANVASLSFSLHYEQPSMAFAIVIAGLLLPLFFAYSAHTHSQRRAAGDYTAEPSWFLFLFVTCFLGGACGAALGMMNFKTNMQPFYDVGNLNEYKNVDVSKAKGNQMMDAGHVVFAAGTRVEIGKSMGFKNLETYCVAPIVIGDRPLARYDFWAVGLNCCSGNSGDFHCGEFSNPAAQAGLRLMSDDDRAFYRLAVEQAEATYSIEATHPIFFEWMQDPVAELSAYQDDGMKTYFYSVFAFFGLQLFLVAFAVVFFSKFD